MAQQQHKATEGAADVEQEQAAEGEEELLHEEGDSAAEAAGDDTASGGIGPATGAAAESEDTLKATVASRPAQSGKRPVSFKGRKSFSFSGASVPPPKSRSGTDLDAGGLLSMLRPQRPKPPPPPLFGANDSDPFCILSVEGLPVLPSSHVACLVTDSGHCFETLGDASVLLIESLAVFSGGVRRAVPSSAVLAAAGRAPAAGNGGTSGGAAINNNNNSSSTSNRNNNGNGTSAAAATAAASAAGGGRCVPFVLGHCPSLHAAAAAGADAAARRIRLMDPARHPEWSFRVTAFEGDCAQGGGVFFSAHSDAGLLAAVRWFASRVMASFDAAKASGAADQDEEDEEGRVVSSLRCDLGSVDYAEPALLSASLDDWVEEQRETAR